MTRAVFPSRTAPSPIGPSRVAEACAVPRESEARWWGRGATLLLLLSALMVGLSGVARAQTVATGDGGSTGTDAAAGSALVSHEAVYDLRLISRAPGSPIATANGTMTYRIEDTCDGWAMETRTKLDLYYNRGEPIRTDWSFISWESKDSTRYRFRIRSERNGTVDQLIDGRARMAPDGGDDAGGVADFDKPEQTQMELSPAVLLPAEHTRRVLEAASEGERMFTAPLFDGSETTGPMQATAVIAEAVPAGELSELPDNALLNGPSWRMVLSFFAADSQSSLPDYEVRLRYHDNGVAEEVIQDFGSMALRGTLRELTALKDGGC
ncbi:cell envelope integrity EipB family protein [Roseospira marina]|uniref:Cell envelope integrity EipB family protein n=1 Tax=Roseospira marina TaxID=140057 RepID=A0A5M6IEN6_9PROT|nr:cell envelope integrity EipB family protein [Roseospira marina]KAA5606724.1 cell envelope integrity EipB family protein [Roseospira marina]MBB4313860.1 hypothetical protein [Roseospira marina]MBB5087022.1 hypothetical protein [Roseospira marina]